MVRHGWQTWVGGWRTATRLGHCVGTVGVPGAGRWPEEADGVSFSVRLASARGEGLSLLACRFVAYYRGRYVVVIDLDAERGAGGGGWGRQSIASLVTLAHSHVCHHAGAEPLAGAWW